MATNKSNVVISTQATLSTTASQVVGYRNERYFLAITNLDAAINVWVGPAGVTITTGHRLAPGVTLLMEGFVGPLFAVATSGTPVVSTIEW